MQKMKLERYFLDSDDDFHWYLVPVSRRKEWERWLDRQDKEAPNFAKRLSAAVSTITFENPQLKRE